MCIYQNVMQTTVATTPAVQDIDTIAVVDDPVLRNLGITQAYHELSAAVAAWIGGGANWCTFATWASRQAGQTIRGEDLLDAVDRYLTTPIPITRPMHRIGRALLRVGLFTPDTALGRVARGGFSPLDVFARASDAAARGNQMVFAEIAHEFARFLAACADDVEPSAATIKTFCAGLRPGDPPDGQGYLRRAFTHYYEARFEPDPDRRAELLLLANLEVGYHEQVRLQPLIRAALDVPVRWRLGLIPARVIRRIITERLMTLTLPGSVLILGEDLHSELPDTLARIDHPTLRRMLHRFEPRPGDPDGCGADDWSDLEDRMSYAARLFGAYHDRPELFAPPFTAAQGDSIRAGAIPDGDL